MRKKLTMILTTFVLVLGACLGLTACNKDSGDDPTTEAKVSGVAIELVNSSYELNDNTITKTYGDAHKLINTDFKVELVYDDNTTKVLSLKTDSADGYTFTQSIVDDDMKGDLVQAGDYTITFSYEDVTVKVINYKVEKANFDTSVLTWTEGLTYNGSLQSPVITNANDYASLISVEKYDDNNGEIYADDYTAKATIKLLDTRNYTIAGLMSNNTAEISHNWTMQKANLNVPVIDLGSYTYNGSLQDVALKNASIFSERNITVTFEGSEDGTGTYVKKAINAATYQVFVHFTYTGSDKNSYNAIPSQLLNWKIDPFIINTSAIDLKDYTDSGLVYNGKEQLVEFDTSALSQYLLSPSSGSQNDVVLETTETGLVGKNADTYTASITFTVKNTNYTVSKFTVTRQWKINKKALTVTAPESKSFEYGTTLTSMQTEFSNVLVSGFVNGEDLTEDLKDLITFEIREFEQSQEAYVGKLNARTFYVIPIVNGNLNNYVISTEAKAFTITKKALTGSIANKSIESSEAINYNIGDLSLSGFAYDETKDNLTITGLIFKYKLAQEDSVWTESAPTEVGTYYVNIASASADNYTFNLTDGTLTITPQVVGLTADNISWNINQDETIVPSYNRDNNYYEATCEYTGNAVSVSLLINSTYGDIFSVTYTDREGEELNEIKAVGTYSIKANVSLKADETQYEFENCSYIIQISIFENCFDSGEDVSSAVAVIMSTTNEESGGEEEASLTFNEFASKTEFKQGTSLKFALANDPAVNQNDEDEGTQVQAVSIMSDEDKTWEYVVMFNDIRIYPDSDGYYEILITEDGSGLIIKKSYSDGDDVEIFVKSNFKVVEIGGNNPGEEGRPRFEIPETIKIDGKSYATTKTTGDSTQYYKLNSTQTKITITVDEEWIDKGLYVCIDDYFRYPIDKTSIVIDIYPYVSTGATLYIGGVEGLTFYGESSPFVILPWSEVDTISHTILDLREGNVNTTMSYWGGFLAEARCYTTCMNSILTNISIELNNEVKSSYSYKIKEKDGVTDFDFTTISLDNTYRYYWIIIYDGDGKEVRRIGGEIYYEICSGLVENINYSDVKILSRLPQEINGVDFSIEMEECALDYTSQVRKSADSEYSDSILLKKGKQHSVDWKMTVKYANKTYTYTRTMIIIVQDTEWFVNLVNSINVTYKESSQQHFNFEVAVIDPNSSYGSIQVDELDTINADDFKLTLNTIQKEYYDADEDIVPTCTNKGFYDLNGYRFIRFEITYSYIKDGLTNNVKTFMDFKLNVNGKLDGDVGFDVVISDSNGRYYLYITDETTSFDINCSTQELTLNLSNDYAKAVIKTANKDGNGNVDDSDGEVVYESTNGYLDCRFRTPGTYVLTITSTNGENTRKVTINVTGEYVSDFKLVFETEDELDTENKTLLCDIEDMEAMTVSDESDFRFNIDTINLTYYLVAYVGTDHGLKITTIGQGDDAKRYLTINSFASAIKNELTSFDGTKITSYPFKLEILTDDLGDYVSVYVEQYRGIKWTLKVYLIDPVSDMEIALITDKTNNADASDLKLTCDIDFENISTTEGSSFDLIGGDGEEMIIFAAFLGDLENLGIATTTTDDGCVTISYNGLASNGMFMFIDGESLEVLGSTGTLILYEYNEIQFVVLYAGIPSFDIGSVFFIFFCDENELPEGFLDDFFGASEDEGDQGGSGEDYGDQDNQGGQGNEMGSTWNPQQGDVIMSFSLNGGDSINVVKGSSDGDAYLANSADACVKDLEVQECDDQILLNLNYVTDNYENIRTGVTKHII